MSAPPTAGAYELELGIITLVVAAPVLALFVANRDLYPIAQREPLMAVASNIGHTILVAVGFLEQVTPGMPLFVKRIINAFCFGVTLGGLLIRIWKLYMDAGIVNERVTGKHGWFIAHRQYRSRNFLLRMAAVIFLVHASVFTCQLASSGNNMVNVKNAPSEGWTSILSASVIVIYFFSFAVFSVKLAGAKDGFFLKFEYRMVGIGSGLVSLTWLIKLVTQFNCVISSCTSFILWFSWIWMLMFSIIHPLSIAMRDRRFGFFRCFFKLRRSKSSVRSRGSMATTVSKISELETPTTHERNYSAGTVAKLRQIPLAKFLTSAPGREAFRDFVVREFSVENLLFVEAVTQLRGRQLISKEDVQNLYDEYIATSAPNQVNLPCIVVQRLEARMKEGDEVVDAGQFDEAREHVMKLMQRDAYRRFQKTSEWHQHVGSFAKDKDVPLLHPDIASITAKPHASSDDESVDSGDDALTRETASVASVEVCTEAPAEIVQPAPCIIDGNQGLPTTESG